MRQRILPTLVAMSLSASIPLPGMAQSSIQLPDMGDFSQQLLGANDEYRLGATVRQQLRDRGFVIEDVQLNEYLASVGQSLASYASRHGNPYTFYWVNNGSINAFATPGGFIGVHSGLLLATENESELAGVLAHETAHVSQRHILRGMADAQRMTLPMAAAMVASVALAASNPKAGSAALAASQAASAQHQVNHTRAHEQEADRMGARILSKAGFNPNGMSDFFKRLDRMPGGLSAQIPEFLRTHPLPSSRMADNIGRFSEKNARPNKRDDTAYHLAKARVRVLTSGNTGGLIRNYETSLSKGGYKNERAERYGYALALKQAGRYEEAQQQITRLRKIDPDRLAFRIEEAEIALARGDRARAWRLFEDARKLYTNDFTLAMHYGQALAARGDSRQAMRILQPHLQRRKDVPALHTVYAQAAQRTGEMGAAYGAMAEHYRINGKLPEAIQQLQTGLNAPGTTPYQQAQLRARLRQLQREEEMAKRHQQ